VNGIGGRRRLAPALAFGGQKETPPLVLIFRSGRTDAHIHTQKKYIYIYIYRTHMGVHAPMARLTLPDTGLPYRLWLVVSVAAYATVLFYCRDASEGITGATLDVPLMTEAQKSELYCAALDRAIHKTVSAASSALDVNVRYAWFSPTMAVHGTYLYVAADYTIVEATLISVGYQPRGGLSERITDAVCLGPVLARVPF